MTNLYIQYSRSSYNGSASFKVKRKRRFWFDETLFETEGSHITPYRKANLKEAIEVKKIFQEEENDR